MSNKIMQNYFLLPVERARDFIVILRLYTKCLRCMNMCDSTRCLRLEGKRKRGEIREDSRVMYATRTEVVFYIPFPAAAKIYDVKRM